jgi:REP element-mobilizing transposase RayT
MYFVTICTRNRACLFGDVNDGVVRLNDAGRIATSTWSAMSEHFRDVIIDRWVVMPNHVHGIVMWVDVEAPPVRVALAAWRAAHPRRTRATEHRAVPTGPKANSLGAMIGSFKSATTRRINVLRGAPGMSVWQRGYYEHIIGDGESLMALRRYIDENPGRWPDRPLAPTPLP